MRNVLAHRAAQVLLTSMVVGAGIATGLLGPRSASAAMAGGSGPGLNRAEIDLCQSDPIITMMKADGSIARLHVDSTIRTNPRNIRRIHYDVHIPSSVKRWSVAYPAGDVPRSREWVTVTADAPSTQLVSIISVDAAARASVVGTAWTATKTVSRSGSTGHPIQLRLTT